MLTSLYAHRCKISRKTTTSNAIGQVIYSVEYLNNDNWIKCRFDPLGRRSDEFENPGVRRAEIKGVLHVDFTDWIETNYLVQIDTNNDDNYEFEFEIYAVNPIYGFAGLIHHQELDVVDVGYE